jgi:hypothetical protein
MGQISHEREEGRTARTKIQWYHNQVLNAGKDKKKRALFSCINISSIVH